jgi:hypothetical protein
VASLRGSLFAEGPRRRERVHRLSHQFHFSILHDEEASIGLLVDFAGCSDLSQNTVGAAATFLECGDRLKGDESQEGFGGGLPWPLKVN